MFPIRDENPHFLTPFVTYAIVALNVIAWVLVQRMGTEAGLAHSLCDLGLIPGELLGRAAPGTTVPLTPQFACVVDPSGDWRTVVTHMFLHGGWFHLISNMWMLWVFGNNIEDRLGHLMYLGYYLVGGIVATLCHWFAASDGPNSLIPVVGASGAVAAVLGGYALTYPTAKVRTLVFFFLILIVDLPALLLLGIWFALQVASGVLGMMALDIAAQPVAFFAHIGGFVAGMVLMPLLSLGTPPPGTDWRKESDDMFRFDDPRRSELDKETGRQGDWENR
jgi:membrane associated rhomboid family serine protease